MPNTSAMKRGFHWSESDGELQIFVNGTKVASCHPTNGLSVEVDGFDLAGQTITEADASGSADLSDMISAYNSGNGSSDEGPQYCLVITVDGTDYYVPAFTSI